jgi:hypothetical protein
MTQLLCCKGTSFPHRHSPTMVPAGTVYLPIWVTLVVILQESARHSHKVSTCKSALL